MITFLCLAVVWCLSAAVVSAALRANWDEVEKELVDENDHYAALGHVPQPTKWLLVGLAYLCGPVVVAVGVCKAVAHWRRDRRIARHFRDIEDLLEQAERQGDSAEEIETIRASMRRLKETYEKERSKK